MLTLSVPYPSPSCTELEGIVLKLRSWSLLQFVIFVFAFPFQIEIWSIRLKGCQIPRIRICYEA